MDQIDPRIIITRSKFNSGNVIRASAEYFDNICRANNTGKSTFPQKDKERWNYLAVPIFKMPGEVSQAGCVWIDETRIIFDFLNLSS